MKILDVNDMIDAAADSDMPNRDQEVRKLVDAAHAFAKRIAVHLGVGLGRTTSEGKEFGGLCASFDAAFEGQKCPAVLTAADPGGDWDAPYDVRPAVPTIAAEEESPANLIAAAPDLLAACKMLLGVRKWCSEHKKRSEILHCCDWTRVESAIAKAEGRGL